MYIGFRTIAYTPVVAKLFSLMQASILTLKFELNHSHAPNKISIIPMMIKEIFNSFICSEYIIPISDRMIANMVTTNWGITISGPTPITGKCFCLFSVSFKLQFLLTISSFRSAPISLKDWNCTTTTYL